MKNVILHIDLGSLVIGGSLGASAAAVSIPITPLLIGKAIIGAKGNMNLLC